MNAAKALAPKAFNAAKSDHWEAAYYVKGSKARARFTAKKEARKALRASERAHIADY